jgi:hypothetical protein
MAAMAFLSFPLLAWRQRDITIDLFDFLAGSPALRSSRWRWPVPSAPSSSRCCRDRWSIFAQRAAASGESTAQLQIPLTYAWWAMCALAAVAALASLVVAIAVFTRHPVKPESTREDRLMTAALIGFALSFVLLFLRVPSPPGSRWWASAASSS